MQRAPASAASQPVRGKAGRAQMMQQIGAAAPAAPKAGAGAESGAPAPKPLPAEAPVPPPLPALLPAPSPARKSPISKPAAKAAASPPPAPKPPAQKPAAKRAARGGVDASAMIDDGSKRARKQVAQELPPGVEVSASGGKNANKIGIEYNTMKKRMDRIEDLLKPSHAGAPPTSEAAAEAVEGLREILGVKVLPSFGAEGKIVEKVQEQHAKKLQELKEAHGEALQTLKDEQDAELEKVRCRYAEKLQAAKDAEKLAELKLHAMQERLDAAGHERDNALARGYEMGLAKANE